MGKRHKLTPEAVDSSSIYALLLPPSDALTANNHPRGASTTSSTIGIATSVYDFPLDPQLTQSSNDLYKVLTRINNSTDNLVIEAFILEGS